MPPTTEILSLLKDLINTTSFSREEHDTANLLSDYLESKSISVHRQGNNVWAMSSIWKDTKPTIILNSHHDTVKPVSF